MVDIWMPSALIHGVQLDDLSGTWWTAGCHQLYMVYSWMSSAVHGGQLDVLSCAVCMVYSWMISAVDGGQLGVLS